MENEASRERFDTAISKIRHEIKSRLVTHGMFGIVTNIDVQSPTSQLVTGTTIEIAAKGKSAARSFDREQIEACGLRVSGAVLVGIIAMVEELAA